MVAQLRKPTRYERFVFWLTRRWPDSYVRARLDYDDRMGEFITEWKRPYSRETLRS